MKTFNLVPVLVNKDLTVYRSRFGYVVSRDSRLHFSTIDSIVKFLTQ